MTVQCIVTTALRSGPEQAELAGYFGRLLNLPVVPRENRSLEELTGRYGASGALVVSYRRVAYISAGEEVFFHPSLAVLRIKGLLAGKTDQMIKAMELLPGDAILDCTLGLGTDAVVASFVSGADGRVTGLEASPLLAALVAYGLAHYGVEHVPGLLPAMRRVEVLTCDHRSCLTGLPANSFDLVYFDPMFRRPRRRSAAIEPLRLLADPAPLSLRAVELARRVARRRVVIKERRGSAEFARLGVDRIEGGRYSPVAYGVIETGGGCR
ncbi:class I SAM-dependent methyltransferase [Desulfotomaculum copahuensis]|uniref:SAM-dependent methyltransferase n=1 Tax=Desulfotomaculum copahuensis TaxID=1838280 RepID=A0A1B7LE78_9FIRM|nr:class I SAM-dependent methyltransferase [Desulfotomaculum copahuensis]OAT81401.1 hypothetical protein A6M21_11050 [Desulfotomaculum copahuensis]